MAVVKLNGSRFVYYERLIEIITVKPSIQILHDRDGLENLFPIFFLLYLSTPHIFVGLNNDLNKEYEII